MNDRAYYALLGVLCALVAVAFVLDLSRDFYQRGYERGYMNGASFARDPGAEEGRRRRRRRKKGCGGCGD